MAALKNVTRIDQIVATSANKYAMLAKNAKISHARLKFLLNANAGIDKLRFSVDLKETQMELLRKSRFCATKNAKIWKDLTLFTKEKKFTILMLWCSTGLKTSFNYKKYNKNYKSLFLNRINTSFKYNSKPLMIILPK